jgi:hypothetical protein
MCMVYLHPKFEQKRRWNILFHAIEGRHDRNLGKACQKDSFTRSLVPTRKHEVKETNAQLNIAAFSQYKGVIPDWKSRYTRDWSGGSSSSGGVTFSVQCCRYVRDRPRVDETYWQLTCSHEAWMFRVNWL